VKSQSEYEIAPGVVYETKQNQHKLILTDSRGDSISWDLREIQDSPASWFESLRAVSLACKYGPSAARSQISQEKLEALIPPGMIVCNMCGSLFGVDASDFYRFCATLNGKEYCDFQCSEDCHISREQEVYKKELGGDFLESWSKKFVDNPAGTVDK
jgi:hypothetical protein